MSCPTIPHLHIPHSLLVLPHQAVHQFTPPLTEVAQVPLGFPDLVVESLVDGRIVRKLPH